jgi:hypothetical protein
MGTFTNRSSKWEVFNSWWLIVQVLGFGMFSFVGFLYIGLLGKRNLWTWLGIASVAIWPLSIYLSGVNSTIFTLTLMANWGGSVAYSFISNKEFLQRLDTIGRGLPVPAKQKYIGNKVISIEARDVIERINGMNALPESISETGLKFIANLKKWEAAVEPADLKKNILRLIDISEQIVKKPGIDSDKFFTRYAEPVDQLLGKYDQIENAHLNSEQSGKSLQEVENFIEKMVLVFEKEYAGLYKNDLLDIDTEVEAFTQSLKNRGLLEDDSTTIQAPTKNTQ